MDRVAAGPHEANGLLLSAGGCSLGGRTVERGADDLWGSPGTAGSGPFPAGLWTFFRREALPIVGRKAHAHASRLSRAERAALLQLAAAPFVDPLVLTLWRDGKFDTKNGRRCSEESWKDFGSWLTEFSNNVIEQKGAGPWFAGAVSSNGGCRDQDIEAVTLLTLDCDGAGDWDVLRELLTQSGLAYVVQRSSSHVPARPKWHVHLPLAVHRRDSKPVWREMYRHIVGWFSAAAELHSDPEVDRPTYGFDPATDRLGQPWFPAVRRSESQPPPETICVDGLAFDLMRFLDLTCFDPVLAMEEASAALPPARRRSTNMGLLLKRAAADSGGGLLKRAFLHAGWLGAEIDEEKTGVRCPWENEHTCGDTYDGSTVLFPPNPGSDLGWFLCSHAHCRDRRPRDVLAALPAEALTTARAELRREEAQQHLSHEGDMFNSAKESAGSSRFNCTDMGNAERLVALHGNDIRFCPTKRIWMTWDGRRWASDNTGTIIELAKQAVRGIYREAERAEDSDERRALAAHALRSERVERVMAIEKLSRSMVPLCEDQVDTDPWGLNVENGTLNLRNGRLQPHRREDNITKLAQVSYDASAPCPTWEAFLDRIFEKNKNLIEFIQRLFGYSLTGDVSEQVLVFLYGTGANGKSTFLLVLQALLGEYATQAAPELLLTKKGDAHPTEVADLFGRRVAVSTEVELGRSLSEVQVKQLTGGDHIKARFMRQDFFEFKPTHKLFLAANHKPRVRGTDHGIWRRIRLIPFAVTIAEHERDKHLLAKLKAELPGILAWAVRGCLLWQKNGLGEPVEVRDATDAYRQEMDRIAGFLEDCCVVEPRSEARAKDLYDAYLNWCKDNGEGPMSQTAFGSALRERGLVSRKSGTVVWCGLRLSGHEGSAKSGVAATREGWDSEGPNSAKDALSPLREVSKLKSGPSPSHPPTPPVVQSDVPQATLTSASSDRSTPPSSSTNSVALDQSLGPFRANSRAGWVSQMIPQCDERETEAAMDELIDRDFAAVVHCRQR